MRSVVTTGVPTACLTSPVTPEPSRPPLLNMHAPPAPLGAGPGGEEVPAVWVDRTGIKVGITEQYSRQSKGSLALVAQARGGGGGGAGAGQGVGACVWRTQCSGQHWRCTGCMQLAGLPRKLHTNLQAQNQTHPGLARHPCRRSRRATRRARPATAACAPRRLASTWPTARPRACRVSPHFRTAAGRRGGAHGLARRPHPAGPPSFPSCPPRPLLPPAPPQRLPFSYPLPCPSLPLPADAGVDRVVSAQAALTRDTTYLANGAQVGARDIITVSAPALACRLRAHLLCYCVHSRSVAIVGKFDCAAYRTWHVVHPACAPPAAADEDKPSQLLEGPRAAVSSQLQTQKLC